MFAHITQGTNEGSRTMTPQIILGLMYVTPMAIHGKLSAIRRMDDSI